MSFDDGGGRYVSISSGGDYPEGEFTKEETEEQEFQSNGWRSADVSSRRAVRDFLQAPRGSNIPQRGSAGSCTGGACCQSGVSACCGRSGQEGAPRGVQDHHRRDHQRGQMPRHVLLLLCQGVSEVTGGIRRPGDRSPGMAEEWRSGGLEGRAGAEWRLPHGGRRHGDSQEVNAVRSGLAGQAFNAPATCSLNYTSFADTGSQADAEVKRSLQKGFTQEFDSWKDLVTELGPDSVVNNLGKSIEWLGVIVEPTHRVGRPGVSVTIPASKCTDFVARSTGSLRTAT